MVSIKLSNLCEQVAQLFLGLLYLIVTIASEDEHSFTVTCYRMLSDATPRNAPWAGFSRSLVDTTNTWKTGACHPDMVFFCFAFLLRKSKATHMLNHKLRGE